MSNAPSYKTNDPRGWGGDPSRGAALGRADICHDTGEPMGKLYLRRVRLNLGGYDPNGTYFGHGAPLYWCSDAEGEVDFVLRARDRDEAKTKVLKKLPDATFWR